MPPVESVPAGGVAAVLFYIIAAVTIGTAMIVVYSRNIVHSGFALLGTFLGVAAIYALLLADFLAIVQLMVYVGGILVLILFAIMLTRQIGDVEVSNRSIGRIQGTMLWLGVLAILVMLFAKTPWVKFAGVQPGATTEPIGDALLSTYLLPFEIASVVLLAALIGAVIMARGLPKRKQKGDE